MNLRQKYILSLLHKMAIVTDGWREFNKNHNAETTAKELFFLLHNLSASAQMYGLSEIAQYAKSIECRMVQKDYYSEDTLDLLGKLNFQVWLAQKQLNWEI